MLPRFIIVFLCAQIIGFIGTWRYTRKLDSNESRQIRGKFIVYFLITFAVPLAVLLHYPFVISAAIILLVGLYEVWSVGRRELGYVRAIMPYSVVAAGFLLFSLRCDPVAIVSVYCLIIGLDGFSQLAGQLFGRRPLAPRISPGKTIEGCLGGVIASVLAYATLVNFKMSGVALLAAVLIVLSGLAGDLLASLFKRRVGVKDFSAIIPFHGGVLDRFDSFILAGFVYYSMSYIGLAL